MLRGGLAALAAAAAALMLVTGAPAGGPALTIGAVEDAAKWGDPVAKMDLARLVGFKAVRMTMQWSSGQTTPTAAELQNMKAAADAARLAGIEPIAAIYNVGSSSTPADDTSRAQFVEFARAVVSGLPSVQRFVVGNEPNLNRYWMPQFNADGSDAAAPAYELLLAASYDAIKAARPDAIVLGGALSPRGEDSPTSTRPTHSPTAFIKDLGAAYRASGRTAPLMDVWDQHVYDDYSAMPPSFEHPNSTTIAVADYGKLVSLLGQAFDGTAQQGSTLPIFYGEYGVESIIPPEKAGIYSGIEPTTTKPVDEPTQAALYEEAFKVVYCQPNVTGIMVFHVSDESALAAWQSGPYYADDTAKASLGRIRDAAAAARAGTLTACPDSTPPTVALTSPSDRATVGGAVTFTASASDNVGVGKVEYLVNDVVLAGKAVPPYTYTWNSGASGQVTITARALDAARNSATSMVTVTVDNTPPETTLTSTPPAISGQSVTFAFDASESGSSFSCSLDGAAATSCGSPVSYTNLVSGPHTFSVAARDALGNVDPTPALYMWSVVDSTPPETTITDGANDSTSATFTFAASEPATFECALDGAPFSSCSSPQAYAGLAAGAHTFSVRATDSSGNVDPTPAARTWTVATAPPNDMFGAAQVISGASGSISGTTLGATKEAGEPNHAGNSGGRSLWYVWTAPATRTYTFETTGSSFNTLLGVYYGVSVSALSWIAANNDADYGVVTSRVKFNAKAGVAYRIAVDGYNGAAGSVTLAWR